MKILVFSDSHTRFEKILEILEKEKPERVICAGDHSTDAEELSYTDENLPFHIVRGNTDFYDQKHEDLLEFELGGKKIFLAHGHEFGVKLDLEPIIRTAQTRGSDIVIFGHTHKAIHLEVEGMHIFNPGAALLGEYGILEIKDNKIELTHKTL